MRGLVTCTHIIDSVFFLSFFFFFEAVSYYVSQIGLELSM
jgi:hypothetical protein